MSVEMRSRDYWEGLDQRAGSDLARNLDRLMQAHNSTAFHNLVLLRHDLGHDRDQCDNSSGSSPSSVHSCEQLPTSSENSQTTLEFPATVEELGYTSDATEALQAGLSRSRDRQRRIIEMIGADEVGHALRYAKCLRQSVQLECDACGSDYNFVPISCDSRLCPECMNRRMGRAIERYGPIVEDMDSPTFGTWTIENTEEMETGVDAVRDAFGKLRRRTIPSSGSVTREVENDDGEMVERTFSWCWDDDGGEPADYYWKSALLSAGKHELARSLQRRYIEQGKQIPFTELVKGGLYGIDIKQQEPGRFHVHIHSLWDGAFVPQPALSSVWEDITGAPVVHMERADLGALNDVVGYVCQPPEFESVEAEVEYLTTLKGSRLLQPFGHLHGNMSRVSGLLRCADCGLVPDGWNYLGLVDAAYDNMTPNWEETGDRPPPDDMTAD